MKKIYTLLLFMALLIVKGFSQNCISLGCAKASTGITTDNTLPLTTATDLTACYNGNKYEQIFWEFFYSPSGGDFTQTFTPTSGTDLSLNYVILDEGTVAPGSVSCPINSSAWTLLACDPNDYPNQADGPGLHSVTATTAAGHYYAVAIINWQDTADGSALSSSYTFDISAPLLNGAAFTPANCPSVLPVSLASFNGGINNCKVSLSWTSTSEINLKNYEVQSSTDGSNFTTESVIPASLSSTDHKYNYSHSNASVGKVYYRLKIIDADNNYKFSKIVPLSLSCNGNYVSVYPNPVSNVLKVNIINLQNAVSVAKLYDNGGKLLYSGQMKNGENTVDMSKFAKGVYLLSLKTPTEVQNIKIIK